MELYYAIVNILDYLALHCESLEMQDDLYDILDELEGISGIKPSEVADANDCGDCSEWYEIVSAFVELYENGERINIKEE